MTRIIRTTLLSLTALACSASAIADDKEPPLFVAESGTDRGDCREATLPCKTIDYALRRVGKNGQVRVAGGSYTLANIEDVAYLVSGAIDVRGGYRETDGFAVRSGADTTLIGLPGEFAAQLSQQGFRVIVDSKGLNREQRARSSALAATQQLLKSNAPATECVNGQAGAFPCNNVDLLAHIADRTPRATGADIWGFLDLNTHREYAIVGYSVGTAVFDVTNPEDPREVGFIDGQSTTWRDIKVYQFWNSTDNRWNAYAYITADNASDGLIIVDLSRLPHEILRVDYSSDFAAAHNVYLTRTDFSTGLSVSGDSPILILAGPSISDGRFRSYSLANPSSPSFIAAPATPPGQPGGDRLYMHDAASMLVSDARKNSQCVNAAAATHCDVLFDFNESSVDIWDVTDPSDPVRLSRTPYANADYTHSGWWSEDRQYLFVQDETDERDRGLPTTLRVFSIADLTAPVPVGTWSGPTNAIDHNGFVRGNRYYMSNYARGLTILDITNPSSPVTVGRFDTYPSSDNVGFPGAWGTYPYLPSGNLVISDIDSGFYVVADNTLDVAAGTLSFAARSFGAEETGPASISVSRSGGAEGTASVNWELIAATGQLDDVTTASGILSWGDGDSADRVISLGLVNDGVAEGLEQLVVKLTSPTGGATLSSPSLASVYINDPGDPSVIEFAQATISVAERGFATAIAIVSRDGSAAGAATIDFSISGGDAAPGTDFTGLQNGTLSWDDGDATPKWIEYSVVDDGSGEADEYLELTLSNPVGAVAGPRTQLRIDILDGQGANQAPNASAGSSQTVGSAASVTLNGSQSNDPDGDVLTYEWRQILGSAVTLNGADTDSASFIAPSVTSDTLLRFELKVTDPGGSSDTAVTSVTVSAGTVAASGGGSGSLSLWLLTLLGLIATRIVNQRR